MNRWKELPVPVNAECVVCDKPLSMQLKPHQQRRRVGGGISSSSNDDGSNTNNGNNYPVVLPSCRHGYCFRCAAQEFEIAQVIWCKSCREATAETSVFAVFEETFVDRCLANRRFRHASGREKGECTRYALDGLNLLVDAIEVLPTVAHTSLSREDRQKAAARYAAKKAELQIQMGYYEAGLASAKDAMKKLYLAVFSELKYDYERDAENDRLGSSTPGYARALERMKAKEEVDAQVVREMGDKERIIEYAKLVLSIADAHLARSEWDDALKHYEEVQPLLNLNDAFGDELCGRARIGVMSCLLAKRDFHRAKVLGETFIKEDSCTPGIHKPLALAQRDSGSIPEGIKTINRAIQVEVPWDYRNKELNIGLYEGLLYDLREEEEVRKFEQMFDETWGELVRQATRQSEIGMVSWRTLKERDMTRFDFYTGEIEEESNVDENFMAETHERLVETAVAAATDVQAAPGIGGIGVGAEEPDDEEENVVEPEEGRKLRLEDAPLRFNRFKITKDVRKWWSQGDPKYKGKSSIDAGSNRVIQMQLSRLIFFLLSLFGLRQAFSSVG